MGAVLAGFFGKYFWGNPDASLEIAANPITGAEATTFSVSCWTSETAADYNQNDGAQTNFVIYQDSIANDAQTGLYGDMTGDGFMPATINVT